jgi:hypothetical protein
MLEPPGVHKAGGSMSGQLSRAPTMAASSAAPPIARLDIAEHLAACGLARPATGASAVSVAVHVPQLTG